jgi:hypothetical protein
MITGGDHVAVRLTVEYDKRPSLPLRTDTDVTSVDAIAKTVHAHVLAEDAVAANRRLEGKHASRWTDRSSSEHRVDP